MRTIFKMIGLSFSGSLPIGIMNMAALQVSLTQGVPDALAFSATAICIEGTVMAGTGLLAQRFSMESGNIQRIKKLTLALLVLLGCFFLFKAMTQAATTAQAAQTEMPGWQYGIWLRLLNPTAIIFWLGVHLAMGQSTERGWSYLVKFAVGGMIGTLCAYSVYIFSAHSLDVYLRPLSSKINLLLACLCFIGAIWRWNADRVRTTR
jgi:threonine/homoserine/homoserine lactone efflux protein